MGETEEEAIVREIHEELNVEIRVERKVCTVEYDYPNFHLTMHCYWCSIEQGELVLNNINRLVGWRNRSGRVWSGFLLISKW